MSLVCGVNLDLDDVCVPPVNCVVDQEEALGIGEHQNVCDRP